MLKKILFFILFLLSFNLTYANYCPNVDLKDDVSKKYLVSSSKDNHNNTTYIYDFVYNKNDDKTLYITDINYFNDMYNLVFYYDKTIQYLTSLNCGFNKYDIVSFMFLKDKRNIAVYDYENIKYEVENGKYVFKNDNIDKLSNLIYNFVRFKSLLHTYNITLNMTSEEYKNYKQDTVNFSNKYIYKTKVNKPVSNEYLIERANYFKHFNK